LDIETSVTRSGGDRVRWIGRNLEYPKGEKLPQNAPRAEAVRE